MFRVVSTATTHEFPTVARVREFAELSGYTFRGWSPQRAGRRPELAGQPLFEGLLGPMYDGLDADGEPVIRYETQDAYDILSQ